MRLVLLLLLAAVLAGPGSPAGAQCRLCGSAPGLGEPATAATPMRLEVETRLDFDRLVLRSPAGGQARLGPDGSRSLAGVEEIGGRAFAGTIVIRGEAGRLVRIDLPAEIRMSGIGGGQIRITDLVSDAPAVARLDSSGLLRVRLGGRLDISGEAEGDYRGEIPITVEYL
ncbi:DUF4402 domain-containing protein [Sphingomonas ginkgonis]|nr:DUF4402 domain-containing protein [Sphingomonas ginkgonis]